MGRNTSRSAATVPEPRFDDRATYWTRTATLQDGQYRYPDFFCAYCNLTYSNMPPANIDTHLAGRACMEARLHPCERVGCERQWARNHCRFCGEFWTCSRECWDLGDHLSSCPIARAQPTVQPEAPPVVVPRSAVLCTFSSHSSLLHYCELCQDGAPCDMCMPCHDEECERMVIRNHRGLGFPPFIVNHCSYGHPDNRD